MPEPLDDRAAVILVADQYEDLELWYPRLRLQEEGVSVRVAGLDVKDYTGKRGLVVHPDMTVGEAALREWDLVVVPGGWAPDKLRTSPAVQQLVRDHHAKGRPIACICHGGWVLASAGILRGATVTGVKAIWDDLRNAGASVVDREVVVSGNLVTSRVPGDLPAFMRETLGLLRSKALAGPAR